MRLAYRWLNFNARPGWRWRGLPGAPPRPLKCRPVRWWPASDSGASISATPARLHTFRVPFLDYSGGPRHYRDFSVMAWILPQKHTAVESAPFTIPTFSRRVSRRWSWLRPPSISSRCCQAHIPWKNTALTRSRPGRGCRDGACDRRWRPFYNWRLRSSISARNCSGSVDFVHCRSHAAASLVPAGTFLLLVAQSTGFSFAHQRNHEEGGDGRQHQAAITALPRGAFLPLAHPQRHRQHPDNMASAVIITGRMRV